MASEEVIGPQAPGEWEEPPLPLWDGGKKPRRVPRGAGGGSDEYLVEGVALLRTAAPVVLTMLLSFGVAIVSQIAVGHIGPNELAAAALANLFMNAFGYSLIIGAASALDSLASQAVGARN
jgi:Na+-driven multidrug efflux pump